MRLQRFQRCEAREGAGLDGRDGVGMQKKTCMLEQGNTLRNNRDTNDMRPVNAPDGRVVIALEFKAKNLYVGAG